MDFPNIKSDGASLNLVANTKDYNSPLTGKDQTAILSGSKWQAIVNFSNRTGADARALKSFIWGLNGSYGRFQFSPPDLDQQGTLLGLPVVDGAGQTGSSINIKGVQADQGLFLGNGDYFSVNGELKICTADISVGQDYIEYDAINLMPSPFDPSEWAGASDPELSYTDVTEVNPSGESFVGEFEYLGGGFGDITGAFNNSASEGDKFYACLLISSETEDVGIRVYFNVDGSRLNDTFVNANNGASSLAEDILVTSVGDGSFLVQILINVPTNTSDLDCYIQVRKVNQNGVSIGQPDAGDKIKCQAAFFGKADDFPARLRANATIPFAPPLRRAPADLAPLEVEDPRVTMKLENSDQGLMQVSAPIIYSLNLSLEEAIDV